MGRKSLPHAATLPNCVNSLSNKKLDPLRERTRFTEEMEQAVCRFEYVELCHGLGKCRDCGERAKIRYQLNVEMTSL